ncbi:MAG: c-type cytochrome biogenesis protein CcsB [Desulfatibacillaceae bacterium]|nr:c-type cytochrome biogenesis protein CcsB [Desulfatibacillaceae bacterium]
MTSSFAASSDILSVVTFVYGLAALLYWIGWIFRAPLAGKVATVAAIAGALGNLAGFGLRWVESYQMGIGRIPLSNLYESLVFFGLVTMTVYLFVEFQYRFQALGAFAASLCFLALAYASLPGSGDGAIRPLLPALQSNWLTAHVATCFLGYAAFALAFGLAHLYLLKKSDHALGTVLGADLGAVVAVISGMLLGKVIFSSFFLLVTAFFIGLACFFLASYALTHFLKPRMDRLVARLADKLPDAGTLDELMHQSILFGFLFLSAGIITGAVWANSAWGRYWSWDPKETWSLITWLAYAVFLHMRLVRGWHGAKTAYCSVFGFFCVLFTWFGVNLLPGLHSYA